MTQKTQEERHIFVKLFTLKPDKGNVGELSDMRNEVTKLTLRKVYGKSISRIEQDWKDWIRSQPLDGNVALVQRAFVLTDQDWQSWWDANKNTLYWSQDEQIYKVKD